MNTIRINYEQRDVIDRIHGAACEHMPQEDRRLRLSWIDVGTVDVPDTHLIAVRFPARVLLEPTEEHAEPWPAVGVYVGMADQDGRVVHLAHSAKGTLDLE